MGLARGTVVAARALFSTAAACASVSFSLLSGVLGREVVVEKEGRRSDVSDGEGGRGVGGRL